MAEGAGTSQSSDYQRAVESLAKRDDGAGSELHRFLKSRPRNSVKLREAGSSPSAELEAMPLSSIHPNAVERTWF
jgi:hypothetical protein